MESWTQSVNQVDSTSSLRVVYRALEQGPNRGRLPGRRRRKRRKLDILSPSSQGEPHIGPLRWGGTPGPLGDVGPRSSF